MRTPKSLRNGPRRLRKLVRNPLNLLSEGIARRWRRLSVKSLNPLARVCDAKVPHTPWRARGDARPPLPTQHRGPAYCRRVGRYDVNGADRWPR